VSGPGRYEAVGKASLTTADGRQISYLRRRFLPQQDDVGSTRPHTVGPGERVDLIAALTLGDPERSWLLADANAVMRPSELSATGRVIRILIQSGVEVNALGQ
jgi:hypothetical protein